MNKEKKSAKTTKRGGVLYRHTHGGNYKPHSVRIAGKRTTLRLEPVFLTAITVIAEELGCSENLVYEAVAYCSGDGNLSSHVRSFVVQYLLDADLVRKHCNYIARERIK